MFYESLFEILALDSGRFSRIS